MHSRIMRARDGVCVTRINVTRLGRPRHSKALPLVKRAGLVQGEIALHLMGL